MRSAEVSDWRRRLVTKGLPSTRLERVAIANVAEVGTIEIPLKAPVSVLSGPNGAGKSVILKAVAAALNLESVLIGPHSGIRVGKIEVSGRVNEEPFQIEYSASARNTDFSGPGQFVDVGKTVLGLYDTLTDIANLPDLLSETDPFELDGAHLNEVRYVACRDYRSVRMYELDVGYSLPFFEVAFGASQYDSRTMGLGELSALYLWWTLKTVQRNSLLLLEEPEVYLSLRSQQALAALIAKYSITHKLHVLIVTHSEAVISFVPADAVVFLNRDTNGYVEQALDPHPALLATVGIKFPLRLIVFVEDRVAKAFTEAMINWVDPSLLRSLEIHKVDGESHLSGILSYLVKVDSLQLKFVGLYDGDMRNKPLDDKIHAISNYLPGTRSIEKIFRDIVVEDVGKSEEALRVKGLKQVLAGIQGTDDHDWLTDISAQLGMRPGEFISRMFHIWIEAGENQDASREITTWLAGFV